QSSTRMRGGFESGGGADRTERRRRICGVRYSGRCATKNGRRGGCIGPLSRASKEQWFHPTWEDGGQYVKSSASARDPFRVHSDRRRPPAVVNLLGRVSGANRIQR